jgi:hypothetical protein
VRSAGFDIVTVEPSALGREETWFVARCPGFGYVQVVAKTM